jgi:hypothetical protein
LTAVTKIEQAELAELLMPQSQKLLSAQILFSFRIIRR